MSIKAILNYVDHAEALHNISVPVTNFENLYTILPDLWDTLEEGAPNGKALSAIQVGWPLRVAVMKAKDGAEYEFINPEIVKATGRMKFDEGCLSVEGGFQLIRKKRKSYIELEYINRLGEAVRSTFNGVDAVCIQHEIDHMDGILISD